jgi:hypothetical protein
MAAAGGLPIPGIVPPGGAPPAVTAPQLPFGADPGTITGWLLDATSTETSGTISRGLERGFNRLVDNIPGTAAPGYPAAMQAMADEIINSDTLITYLTVTNIPNDEVRVTTVHSIAKYSAGFGGSNALHGQTLALLGETVGPQLPTLVRFNPDPQEDLLRGLRMENMAVPPDALVDTYFASPVAENLMPQPTVAQGRIAMNLARFCPLPTAWAPYFLDFKTPFEALQTGRTLVATMTDVGDRTRAGPLLDWLRGSCVRLGTNATSRRLSRLNHNFEPTAPDARVVKWMQAKIAPYLQYAAPTAPPAQGGSGGAPVLPSGTNRTGEREYSLLETSKIQAACGLTDAQWETDLPELYTRMLEEGRTTPRVKSLLEDIFRPDDDFSLSAVQLNVTDELAKDIKNINLGYNNDMSYECCHRGLSPFAMIGVSMATASKRRRMADRFTRTNNLTLAEVTMADTTPDPIPTGYHGAVNLLRRYVGLLQHVTGGRCAHHTMVRQIAAELCRRQDIFENLEAKQIASLLWQIFMDARRFFSAGIDIRGNLPQSLLRSTYNDIATGIVQAHLNVPYAQLLGQESGQPSYSSDTGAEAVPRTRSEPRTFRHVPAAIKTILRGARSKYPSLTVAELMGAHVPPLQYAQVKLGPNGSCLDYLCLGACKNGQCTYKHTATASIATARAEAVAPKLGAAYTAYDAAQA